MRPLDHRGSHADPGAAVDARLGVGGRLGGDVRLGVGGRLSPDFRARIDIRTALGIRVILALGMAVERPVETPSGGLELLPGALQLQVVHGPGQQAQRLDVGLEHLAHRGDGRLCGFGWVVDGAEHAPDRHHALLDQAFQLVFDAHRVGR